MSAECTGQAKAMVNNSGLFKLKRTLIRKPYTRGSFLNVKNIFKPLENMNINYIHDITV